MAEAVCSNHPDVGAVGKCFQCKKPFCLDCLDLETGKPICKECLAGKAEETSAPPAPVPEAEPEPVAPPVIEAPVFQIAAKTAEETAISLDDFGLASKPPEEVKPPSFKVTGNLAFMDTPSDAAVSPDKPTSVEVKVEVPVPSKVTGPLAFMDSEVTAPVKPVDFETKKEAPVIIPLPPVIPSVEEKPANPAGSPFVFKPMKSLDNDPLGLFKENAAPPSAKPLPPKPVDPVVPPPAPSFEPKPPAPLPPMSFPLMPDLEVKKPAHVSNVDMASMMKKLDTAEKVAPKAAAFNPDALVPPAEKTPSREFDDRKKVLLNSLSSRGMGSWQKFDSLGKKFKVPGYLFAAILLVLLAGGLTFFFQKPGSSIVKVVDTVPQITIVSMDASQVTNLDITAFTELYTHLGQLGFIQILQMTVPQLLPNFFDVGMKEDEGIYSEIIMMPNQIAPRLSFVTVFTNGVWYSTNGWAGTNQQLDYLQNEFYPDQSPEQLYAQHKQGIEKLQTANGWQIQTASQNRYMADLSDHLRWYLKFKNVSADQIDFASWH
jgi:hypothetical protein